MRIHLHTPEGIKEIEISEDEALKKGYITQDFYFLNKLIRIIKKNPTILEKLKKL